MPHTVYTQKFHSSKVLEKQTAMTETFKVLRGVLFGFLLLLFCLFVLLNSSTRNMRPDLTENVPETNTLLRLQIVV